MRGEAFTRQLRLLQLLETRGAGLELGEAAEELQTGRRTVYRDFEVLQDAGFPLLSEKEGSRARWRMMEGYRHRLQLSLSWSEVLALSTGAELMKGLSGTMFHEGAVSALEKIRATLPKALAERVRAGEKGVSTTRGGHDYSTRTAMLAAVVLAVQQRRTLVVRYRSRSKRAKPASRKLDPYHLRVTDQGLYVIGHCHRSRSAKTFLLDRFVEVRESGESFTVTPGFAAEDFLAGSYGMWGGKRRTVSFTVSPELGQLYLEKKIHPSQLAQQGAHGVDVTLEVAISPPLIAHLAGLGPALTRVQPAELRDAVVKLHREALAALGTRDQS